MWRSKLSAARSLFFSSFNRPPCGRNNYILPRRQFLTLAIETSCDDTSVALLETQSDQSPESLPNAKLLFHEKVTAASAKFRGIHPLYAHESHQAALPGLLSALRQAYGSHDAHPLKPDLVTATRGPGILACLQVGLNTAKGLALAWDVPFIGAHHMQAHALTPRLESALNITDPDSSSPKKPPSFPFLSALVSGGHTLLLQTDSLTEHRILTESDDIAIGDCLDKVGRAILPTALLDSIPDSSYGRLLESYAFPEGLSAFNYEPPRRRQDEIAPRTTQWGWAVPIPTIEQTKPRLSFSGIESTVTRIVAARTADQKTQLEEAERRALAFEAMRSAFELLAVRSVQALQKSKTNGTPMDTLVVSGGVAANGFLRQLLRRFLDARGFEYVRLCFPAPDFCTDNAAMIAWAAWEMYQAGWVSELNCKPVRRWPLDSSDGGGILDEGWKRRVAESQSKTEEETNF